VAGRWGADCPGRVLPVTEGEALRAWLSIHTGLSLKEAQQWVEMGSRSGWTAQQTQFVAVQYSGHGVSADQFQAWRRGHYE